MPGLQYGTLVRAPYGGPESMLNRVCVLVLTVVCWLAHPPAARAAPPGSPGAATAPAASGALTQHLQRGERERRAGRWAEAESAYRAAWQIEQRADIAGELGICELALGKDWDAAEHLQLSLEQSDDLPTEQRRRIEEAYRKAEQQVATLAISAHPSEAEVFVDDRPAGAKRLSYLVFVDPGAHTVRATLAGFEDVVVQIDTARGGSYPMGLRLRERPATPPPPPIAAPAPPLSPRPCPTSGGCERHPLETLRYAGLAAAGAGVAFGAGALIGSEVMDGAVQNKAAALGPSTCRSQGARPDCKELRELNEGRNLLGIMATASLITATGVGLVTAASFWWWPPRQGAQGAVRVLPATARDRLGVVLVGQW